MYALLKCLPIIFINWFYYKWRYIFFYFEAIIVWMTSDRNCKILFFILFSLYLLSSELRITHLLRTKFEVKTKKVFFVFSLSSFLFLFCNFFWETEVMRLSTWKIHFLWNVFFIWKVKTAKWHAKRCRQTDRQTVCRQKC